ncbi:bifunctional lysylphosphatidylglycerol flippase/synthetase MprF, partial [Paeniglutamicibacter sp. MACA_103]|uniref:bifunctional lysylphosphatidylglycerol flippase/synthetase MprF n=1 Tax=Paeniglutamicibacter sp. MACA_103 TaxID=3377337 RepID=UPI003892EC27
GVFARAPFTAVLWLVVLGGGVATGALSGSVGHEPWFAALSYGLPSFSTGNWFTTLSGMFILSEPVAYLSVLALIPLGVGWLEATRGTRTAVLAFFGGQIASVLLTAATLLLFRNLGSEWIDALANDVDTGPSGGIFAALTLAACHVRQPWRARWQFLLLAFAVLSATLFGEVPDLEHSAAILLVLILKRRSIDRPNLREQRFIAWAGLLGLVAVQILTILVPTHGPFGPTQAGGGRIAVLFDAALAIGLARGLRSGRRIAWIAALVLAVLNVLRGVLGISLVLTMGPQLPHGSGLASLAAAVAGLWLLLAAHLLVCWRAFGILRHRRLRTDAGQRTLERADVVTALKRHGGGTLSWMGTWDGNEHHLSPGGSLLAYQVHAGCAISLADPVGPPQDRDAAMNHFAHAAEEAGLIPCFFSASAPPAAHPDRWRAMEIAADTLVALPNLEFAGKAWSDVRTALNRAARERVGFRLTLLIDEPAEVRRQLEEISSAWVGDKSLPQLRFTLGTLAEAADPAVRVALAEDAAGEVQGFLSWLPVHAPGGAVAGWTLDLMRRREGGFGPVMELLIASSLRGFAAEGAAFASLSGAPLAHIQHQRAEEPVDRVLAALSRALEPLYGFGSLQAFKAKFNPRTVPLYLVYRDESDLPRIAGGLARAFVPEASVGQLAREGFGALRELRGRRGPTRRRSRR